MPSFGGSNPLMQGTTHLALLHILIAHHGGTNVGAFSAPGFLSRESMRRNVSDRKNVRSLTKSLAMVGGNYLSNIGEQSGAPETTSDMATEKKPVSSLSYLESLSRECDAGAPVQKCAPAITSYLDALSAGAAQPESAPAAAITSYLEGISSGGDAISAGSLSGAAVTSYMEALSSGAVAPPSTEAITSYLDAVSTGEVAVPSTAASIASYLDTLNIGTPVRGSAGIPSYVGSMRASTSETSGAGMASYLDTVGTEEAAAVPYSPPLTASSPEGASTPDVTPAPSAAMPAVSSISYLESLSRECDTGAPVQKCAPAITSYLDALSTGAAQPESAPTATITSYLDTLSGKDTALARSSGAAVTSYLVSLSSGAVEAPSKEAVMSYLEAVSGGEVPAPPSGAAFASYLDTEAAADVLYSPPASFPWQSDETILSGTTSTEMPAVSSQSYLESITEQCDGDAPTPECAPAVTSYLDALSTGAVQPEAEPLAAVVSFLDGLSPKAVATPDGSSARATAMVDIVADTEYATPGDTEYATPEDTDYATPEDTEYATREDLWAGTAAVFGTEPKMESETESQASFNSTGPDFGWALLYSILHL